MTTVIDLRSGEPVITTEPPLDSSDVILYARYSGEAGGAVSSEFGGMGVTTSVPIPTEDRDRCDWPSRAHDWRVRFTSECGRVVAYTGLLGGGFLGFRFGRVDGRWVQLERWANHTSTFRQLGTGYQAPQPCPARYTFEPDRPQE